MAANSVAKFIMVAAKHIPWKEIAKLISSVVAEPAKKKFEELIGRIGKPNPGGKKSISIENLDQRIIQLEQLSIEVGNHFTEIETHKMLMAETIQTLSARIMILIVISSVSLILSIAALVLILT